MSAQDDVAALLRSVEKCGTVEERVTVLVAKLQQTLQGMKLNVADPNVLTVLDRVVAELADNREAIVRAVTGHKGEARLHVTKPQPVAMPAAPETVPEWFGDEPKVTEATRPEPEPADELPEPLPVVHRSKAKLKLPARRARR